MMETGKNFKQEKMLKCINFVTFKTGYFLTIFLEVGVFEAHYLINILLTQKKIRIRLG